MLPDRWKFLRSSIFTYWCLLIERAKSPPRNSMGIVHAGGTCSFVDGPATKFNCSSFSSYTSCMCMCTLTANVSSASMRVRENLKC